MTRRRPFQFFAAIAMVVVALTTTLLALETALRIFYLGIGALRAVITQAPGRDSRAYVLKPGARVAFTGLHQKLRPPVDWIINAQGLRSDRVETAVPEKFRIATFGDSETFGWSVQLDDTFQRQMEAIDPNVVVTNFGVPGYNVENVADAMAEELPGAKAGIVIYLFHKNDLDSPLTFSRGFAESYLYLFYRKSVTRIAGRFWPDEDDGGLSSARTARLAREVTRMIGIARRANAPLLIGLMDWRFADALPRQMRRDCATPSSAGACAPEGDSFWAAALDIDSIRQRRKRFDGHMPPATHREVAALLCQVISGGRDRNCVLPGWRKP